MATDLVMIAYDGTDNAKRAIDYAARFLTSHRAVVVTAWEPMVRQAARMSGLSGVLQPEWAPEAEAEDIALTDAKTVNQEGVDLARAAGFDADGRCAECRTTIWNAITSAADELDADVIVSGTRGLTGIRALLQSSVADQVLKHGHRPVLVVPPGKD
ncbi:universal stress protein [Rhodococcus rhodnii]|uniref:Universal stress protein n=2 Tax=Rhodococcus rhodnii TaxID=38312 RepID=R7WN36_9NOCA|nr:universal stress protein [Rhodococcus rhodnii]EOM76705.1 universal stress protein [Rhodococcus rhodnii LMG 5362]TXG90014.1 universal stress protein [Rhodococcus rhodnii]